MATVDSVFSKPQFWKSLLWKDLRQVRDPFLAITGGSLALQVLQVIGGTFLARPSERAEVYGLTFGIAILAPLLMAVGSAAMMVGHERETGSWEWSSSLPVSWWAALLSKLFASLGVCVLVGVTLCLIPLILLWQDGFTLEHPLNSGWRAGTTMMLLSLFETLCFFALAALIFRETLTGVVAALLAQTVGQSLLIGLILAAVTHKIPASNESSALFYLMTFFAAAIAAFTVIAFRWRWSIGQHWSRSSANQANKSVRAVTRSEIQSLDLGDPPSTQAALLWHAWETSRTLRILLLLASVSMTFWLIVNDSMQTIFEGPVPAMYGIACLLIGASCFSGDNVRNRFRFWSDRGCSPNRYVYSHIVVALVWVIAIAAPTCFGIATIVYLSWEPLALTVASCFALFALGSLGSICFRQTIVALTAVAVVFIGTAITTSLAGQLCQASEWLSSDDFMHLALPHAFWITLSGIALVVAHAWLGKRWFVLERTNNPLHFIWIATLAGLAPIFLSLSLAFLLEENPPLAIRPSTQILTQGPSSATEDKNWKALYQHFGEVIEFETPPGELSKKSYEELVNRLRDRWNSLVATRDSTLVLEAELVELENCLASPPSKENIQVSHLCTLVANSALAGKLALVEGQTDIAQRWWVACRKLQELLLDNGGTLQSIDSRRFALSILSITPPEELTRLGGPSVLESFIPPRAMERESLIESQAQLIQDQIAFMRGAPQLSFNPAQRPWWSFYPPMRWRAERKLAQELSELSARQTYLPNDFATGAARDAVEELASSTEVPAEL